MGDWRSVLDEKISDLELVASWASLVGYGRVRDLCRNAQCELRQAKERWEKAGVDPLVGGPDFAVKIHPAG